MAFVRRLLAVAILAIAALAAAPAAGAMAVNVELLHGTVRDGNASHPAAGRVAVIKTESGKRLLTVRKLDIRNAGAVRVYLVPRKVRGNRIGSKRIDLGKLKGNKGNQKYTIPRSADLRRYNTVIFWCVPFSVTLGRADLKRS